MARTTNIYADQARPCREGRTSAAQTTSQHMWLDAFHYCMSCCAAWSAQTRTIAISARSLKIIRLLGEGGFSYVYLVADESGQEFAMKKIRCLHGPESVSFAMKEIEASKMFNNPSIIRVIDHAIVQELDGTQTVYLLLPYYSKGNLQELINQLTVRKTELSEEQIISYAKDICIALSHIHGNRSSNDVSQDLSDNKDPSETANLLTLESDSMHTLNDVPYAHFDLKPANLMINRHNRLVLMDFGSCKPARIKISTRSEA